MSCTELPSNEEHDRLPIRELTLQDENWWKDDGTFIVVCGGRGAGKTSLVRLLLEQLALKKLECGEELVAVFSGYEPDRSMLCPVEERTLYGLSGFAVWATDELRQLSLSLLQQGILFHPFRVISSSCDNPFVGKNTCTVWDENNDPREWNKLNTLFDSKADTIVSTQYVNSVFRRLRKRTENVIHVFASHFAKPRVLQVFQTHVLRGLVKVGNREWLWYEKGSA